MSSSIISDTRPAQPPELTLLIPVYNERRFIADTLRRISELPIVHELVVVDDGSNDGTREILQNYPHRNTLVLFHERNQGKGGAIRTALAQARGTYTAIQDADLEYDPFDYKELLRLAKERNLQVVFGSRFLRENPRIYRRFLWGNKVLTAWINWLCGARYTDTYTCYKLMETPVFQSLDIFSSGFEMEAEISVKVARRNLRFMETPIHYQPRRVEEGKKIGWRDAWIGLMGAYRWAKREKAVREAGGQG